jgi:[ribosomal protein S5]-alanine N-acetyltransferase
MQPQDAKLMLTFRLENRDHLTQWEPKRPPEFYTLPFWQAQFRAAIREFRHGASVCLVILSRDGREVLGVCNYTNIIRGTFEAAHLGYALSQKHQGKGIMFEALEASRDYIFDVVKLHRIMANYLPRNHRSGALLKRLGFEIEGEAKKLLKINGVWEDHIMTSLINPGAENQLSR